jgi:tetratricopeptide (TPR) repeat protein
LSSATYLCDAAECMQRTDPLDAVALFQRAVGEFASLGRFLAAAAVQREIADIHELQHALFEAAVALSNAADYYVGEALPHPAVACLVRAGEHFVEDERYSEAAKRFLQAISLCLDDNLMKFNGPQLALATTLCYLALRDDTKAMDFVEQHAGKDPLFLVSREKRFLLDVILAAQERRPDDFMDHCWNFDYVYELHPHHLRLLHEVYEAILDAKEAEEGLVGEESESEDSWVAEEEEEEEEDEGEEEGEEGEEERPDTGRGRETTDDEASTTGASTERSEP